MIDNNQINIFDIIYDTYKITKPIRLIELFAGYGSQALALKYLGVNFEHHFICEFDKYAIDTYNAFHNTNFKTSDITKINSSDLNIVDTNKFTYLLTYSFPCTDLSLAGNRKGMEKGSGTRSGLLWEVERLLNELKQENKLAQILVMENVPQVITANGWKEWNTFLDNLGYKNYCQILNAKDFGIPQNRQRAFMVSILGDYNYNFPKTIELKYRLKDILEKEVDEKYYLSDKMIQYISETGTKNFKNPDCKINLDIAIPLTTDQNKRAGTTNYIGENIPNNYDLNKADELLLLLCKNGELDNKNFPVCCDSSINNPKIREISNCITSRYNAGIQNQQQIGTCVIENKHLRETTLKNNLDLEESQFIDSYNRNIRNDGLSGTIHTRVNASSDTYVAEIKPKLVGGIGEKKSNNGTQYYQQDRIYDSESIAMCHPANLPNGSYMYQLNNLRIRKLTPKECYRLMGVKDEEINKTKVSNAQQYKQAGNSIVTTCLMGIFGELIGIDYVSKINELVEEICKK
ncbi:MAG: DNA (cytosine-5-)-methyltransferase [Candidatus Coprovivens sp.]